MHIKTRLIKFNTRTSLRIMLTRIILPMLEVHILFKMTFTAKIRPILPHNTIISKNCIPFINNNLSSSPPNIENEIFV